MSEFDFSAPADVYMTTARGAQRRPLTYRRFDSAAEAIRFAIEDLGQDVQRGTVMEVDGDRFPLIDIRALYDSDSYPLVRKAGEAVQERDR